MYYFHLNQISHNFRVMLFSDIYDATDLETLTVAYLLLWPVFCYLLLT